MGAEADYLLALLDFKQDGRPLDVFTLNYDRLIETVLARRGVTFTTGFADTWTPSLLQDDQWDVRLHKLHGSVDWLRGPVGRPIYRGEGAHFAFPEAPPTDVLLYPAQGKSASAEPFATLISLFGEALQQSQQLICIGYSFGDPHIRQLVLDRMDTNRSLRVLIVDPAAEKILETDNEEFTGETHFSDFPDRVVGLWRGAKEALEGRQVGARLDGVRGWTEQAREIRDDLQERAFEKGAGGLLNLVQACTQDRSADFPSMVLLEWSGLQAQLELEGKIRPLARGVLLGAGHRCAHRPTTAPGELQPSARYCPGTLGQCRSLSPS